MGLVGSPGGGRRFGYLTMLGCRQWVTFGNGTNNSLMAASLITDYGTNVKWAKSHKQDLGVELKALDSKVSLTVDYFNEHRTGVSAKGKPGQLCGSAEFSLGQYGIIDNRGFDGTLEIAPFDIGKTSWTFQGNLLLYREK